MALKILPGFQSSHVGADDTKSIYSHFFLTSFPTKDFFNSDYHIPHDYISHMIALVL
jgi:hypothetical protein